MQLMKRRKDRPIHFMVDAQVPERSGHNAYGIFN
jgi:hypothetical protein